MHSLRVTTVVCCVLAALSAFGSAMVETPLSSNELRIVTAQVALLREGISPGPIDGLMGGQTESALRAFQERRRLRVSGELDENTRTNLPIVSPLFTAYFVTSNDLARLAPLPVTWLGKSVAAKLDYETVLELVSERRQTHHKLLQALNPSLNWSNVAPNTPVLVPNVQLPSVSNKAAFVQIRLSERILQAYDFSTNLLAHFPCSIAQRVDKRPIGELHVAVLVSDPNYTFDPSVFSESAEAQEIGRKLILPPGPNNPVGTVWIGLDRAGYGIHGTPLPEKVGRTESHGCFRLANWNAEYLLKLAWVGMPVIIQP
jgi:lipoprotein-anchoring transpeptidase ErfK/SrfK